MPHCCDLQIRDEQKIQRAIETLRSILRAAENGNQAGEDAAVLAVAAPELMEALKSADEEIGAIHRAFGAPGDHGYGTPEGKTLYSLYQFQARARAAITQATAR